MHHKLFKDGRTAAILSKAHGEFAANNSVKVILYRDAFSSNYLGSTHVSAGAKGYRGTPGLGTVKQLLLLYKRLDPGRDGSKTHQLAGHCLQQKRSPTRGIQAAHAAQQLLAWLAS